MTDGRNILQAIVDGDSARFLALLDHGFQISARIASDESRRLRLRVVDGRSSKLLDGTQRFD